MRVRDVVSDPEQEGLWCAVNRQHEPDLDRVLVDGDEVLESIKPRGVVESIALFIGQQLLYAAGAYLIGKLIGSLFKPKKRNDDSGSNTYAWSGLRNDRLEGQPLQAIYGRIRVAPQVIDEYIQSDLGTGENTLYSLLAFGEGPIYAIGSTTTDNDNTEPFDVDDPARPLPTGIQIEGNAAENFTGIRAWVRMGTSEQEAIPGFELVNTEYSGGQTLTQLETTASSNQALNPDFNLSGGVPYNADTAPVQAVWDAYAVGIDMTSTGDEFAAQIDFPSGLYTVSGSGSIQPAYFTPLVRYIELDAGGVPITSGGDNGDGWVYVPPTGALAVKQQESFNYQISAEFRDPTGYTAGTLGRCLTTGTSNADYAASPSPAVMPGGMVAGQQMQEMTISGWFYFSGDTWEDDFSENQYVIASHSSTGPNRGWLLFMEKEGAPAYYKFRLSGYSGASAFSHLENSSNQIPRDQWIHLAFVWDYDNGDADPNKRVTRAFYVNGALWSNHRTNQASAAMQIASGPVQIGGYSTLDPDGMLVDEFAYRYRALSAAEVAAEYNAGLGRFITTGSDTSFVALYHFDSAGSGLLDSSANANNLTLNGACTAGSTFGKVFSAGTGNAKRAKYRVQVLRLNLKSTSQFVQDESVYSALYTKLQTKLAYPYTPLLATVMKATDQLNTSAPTTTALVDGLLCPVWDGSAITYQWTNNPAWVALDIATNPRYGLGQVFPFSRVNLTDFSNWADYCDALIPDGRDYNTTDIDENPVNNKPVRGMVYSSSTLAGTPIIRLYWWANAGVPAFTPPSYWTVGRYLAFDSIPVSGGGVDINATNIEGLEIVGRRLGATGWEIDLAWDQGTYGDPWTDDTDLATSVTLAGTVYGVEKRFTFNGVFDEFSNGWDSLVAVCQTARAMPRKEGGTLRVSYERPRSTVAIVTMAQIRPGSFKLSYSDKINLPNSYSCDFLDEDQNFSRSVAQLDDPALDLTVGSYDLVREPIDLPGVTRRSQVMRHLWYLLNLNRLATQGVEWAMSLDSLTFEVGDVVALAHDLVPWGTSGAVGTGAGTTTSVYIDRDVDTTTGTWYLRVRSSALGQSGSGASVSEYIETRTVSTAGAVAYGAAISVSSAFSFIPQKGDSYILYKADQERLFQIVETSLSENMERTFRALRYDPDVYAVDEDGYTLPQSVATVNDTPEVNQSTIPNDVTGASVGQLITKAPDGSFSQVLSVSWRHDPTTMRAVAGTRILWRNDPLEGWTLAGVADGCKESYSFAVPDGDEGRYYEVCIQPVSFAGTRRRPEGCTKVAVELRGIYVPPDPPTAFTATMNGDQAVYTITPPENARGLSYEIRRGGWILGQPVAVIPEGQTSIQTNNWVGAGANALGESAAPLYVRSMDSRGQYSRALQIDDFNPAPDGAVVLEPPYSEYTNWPDQAWEDFNSAPGAWTNGGLNQPTLSNLQVTAYDGRNVIEFAGSALTGVYTTAGKASATTALSEWAHVQIHAVVDQVSPFTVADFEELAVNDPIAGNYTAEGLLTPPRGSSNCTLAIAMRFKTTATGSYGDWVDYKPGLYNFVNVQFRLTFTRPDTLHNFRMYRLHSRLSRLPVGVWERNPVQDAVLQRMKRG